jgi:replicative DNA helicase
LLGPVGGDIAGMDDVGQAEYATVGSLMLAPAGLDRVAGWLRPEDFRDPLGQEVFGVLLAMRDRWAVIDPVTVLGELRRRGRLAGDGAAAMALIRMVEAVPVPGAVTAYGRLVLAASIGRQLEAAGTRLAQVGRGRRGEPSDWLDRATEALGALDAARARWDTASGTGPVDRTSVPAGRLERNTVGGTELDRLPAPDRSSVLVAERA